MSSFNVSGEPIQEFRFPKKGGYYAVTLGYRVSGITEENRYAVAEKIRHAMTPAPFEMVEGWLALLDEGLGPQRKSAATAAARLTLYASSLVRYPADIARDVIFSYLTPSEEKVWFPSLPEMLYKSEQAVSDRRALANAVGVAHTCDPR